MPLLQAAHAAGVGRRADCAPGRDAAGGAERVGGHALRPGATDNWQGGTLYLFLAHDALAFVPHAFNFGALERATIPLDAITGAALTVGLIADAGHRAHARRAAWGLRVRKGDTLRDALRARRGRRALSRRRRSPRVAPSVAVGALARR